MTDDNLAVATQLGPTPQPIQDQEGDASPLEIGTNSVVISGKANFGIGITPEFPLHVGSDCTARFELGENSQLSLGGQGVFNVDAVNVPAGRFTVTNNGNVGINQANPGYQLDVNGPIHGTLLYLSELPPAPAGISLKSVVYSPINGILYYQP